MTTDAATNGDRTQPARPAGEHDHRRSRVGAYVLLAAGMALFGSATPVSKIVGAAFPALLASALRMVTAAVVLVPFVAASGSVLRTVRGLSRRDWLLLAGIAGVGTFGFTLLLLYGLRMVPGAVAAVVMATTPAVTAAGAILFLHDHLDRWKVAGIGAAVAGVVAVNLGGAQGGTRNVWLGTALVFGAVVCEATYSLMGKRLTADVSPVALAMLASVLAGLLFLPFAVLSVGDVDLGTVGVGQWVALVWWGAGTMGLGSVLWFRGMQRVAAATAAAFMVVMPVSALLLSYVLLGEAFYWSHAVGLAGVLVGLAAVVRSDQRH